MNYTFKIIDTQRDDLTTSVEKAVGGSIILEWLGGDKKDELTIVGSRLSFTMVGMSMADGQYLDLFTGDETRYRVIQEDTEGNIIWQGFILPDSYSEPYSNAPILVDFVATDGLGRLKGKYLADDFYKEEKSVIEIIAACLRLTGLDLSFRFAPAIENAQQKDYNQIYLDTSYFKDKDKKEDAYKILNDLLESMLCTVYQADNFYNIEGLNVRNQRVYNTKVYAPDGTLTGVSEVTRRKINITGIATPQVEMQPPYGVVNVNHRQEPLSLPEGLSKETNDGWSILGKVQRIGVDAEEVEIDKKRIHATEWFGNLDFYAYAGVEKDPVVFFGLKGEEGSSIRVRRPVYVEKGRKYEVNLDFELTPIVDYTREEIENVMAERWVDPFGVFGYIDSDDIVNDYFGFKSLIFGNGGEFKIIFNADKKSENKLQFTAPYSGLFNIGITGVTSWLGNKWDRGIKEVKITKATLADLGHKENYIAERILTEEYTAKKDFTLIYGDDPTGLSKSFRLQKLNEPNNRTDINIPIIRTLLFQGKTYAVVSLWGANLIKENLDDNDGLRVFIEDVHYNFNEGEEHVVELKRSYTLNHFPVYLRDFTSVTEVRDYWRQWTDSYYGVEKLRYPEVVANIYNRCFDKPIYKVPDFTVKNNILFNDFIDWKFKDNNNWMLSYCRWDIDNGYSSITALENYYAVKTGENIPPVVEAGDDTNIEDNFQQNPLTCEAYDPDGFITTYLWEEISGTGEVTILNPNNQNTAFTIDANGVQAYYEFRITVTDNEGATASDTIKFYRNRDTSFSLEEVYSNEGGYPETPFDIKHYKIVFDPEIPTDTVVRIDGNITAYWLGINHKEHDAEVSIEINGVVTKKIDVSELSTRYSDHIYNLSEPFQLNFYKGDETIIKLKVAKNRWDIYDPGYMAGEAYAKVDVDNIHYTTGTGEISGFPVTKEASIVF